MKHLLKNGLSISGPAGSGKSTLAKTIAESQGVYRTISAHQFANDSFNDYYEYCSTVIVEGCDHLTLVTIESLMMNSHVRIHRRGKTPIVRPIPNMIFVMDCGHKPKGMLNITLEEVAR